MLVQVTHRGWVFIQGFYYKNKGRFAKIRVRRNKNKHATTASTAATYTQRSGSYNTRSNIQVTYNLLLTSNYHNTRLSACKFFTSSRTTPGDTESFTPDYTMQNTRNIKNILKNTNNNYLMLRKYQGSYPKYLILNKDLKLLKKKVSTTG